MKQESHKLKYDFLNKTSEQKDPKKPAPEITDQKISLVQFPFLTGNDHFLSKKSKKQAGKQIAEVGKREERKQQQTTQYSFLMDFEFS